MLTNDVICSIPSCLHPALKIPHYISQKKYVSVFTHNELFRGRELDEG